jgi:hypothetical protein
MAVSKLADTAEKAPMKVLFPSENFCHIHILIFYVGLSWMSKQVQHSPRLLSFLQHLLGEWNN